MAIASYQSADGHLDSSVFSGQDLALVKSGQWLPELSHFVPINSPHDIDVNLDHARDDGEKIDLLLTTALNPHTDTLRCLGEFIQSRDLTILAATLRAFASIGEMLKDSSLDPEYRHHLEHLRWVLTENLDLTDEDNPSVQLFKRLCQEAESGSSDLIRWAAAYALQQLNYPAGLRRQLLSKPPAEIGADILPKYLRMLSGQEHPLQDREYLKFWVYGPTEVLFHAGSGTYYLDVVRNVLSKLGIRGIRLALQYGNGTTLGEAAVNCAGTIFNQIDTTAEDKRYVDEATRQSLANRLLPFLNIMNIELRNLVAEKLNDKNNQYQVSDKLLKESDRIRAAVMDVDYRRIVTLGDPAVPLLCDVVEGSLRFRSGTNNLDLEIVAAFQIVAAETINEILTEPSKKTATLSPYLQHDNDKVRMKIANLLKPFQNNLDTASSYILAGLLFTLDLPYESSISSLNKLTEENRATIESCLANIKIYQQSIQQTFSTAISSCKSGSIATRNFLSQLKQSYTDRIQIYSSNLTEDLSRRDSCIKLLENKKETELIFLRIQKDIDYVNSKINKHIDEAKQISQKLEKAKLRKDIYDSIGNLTKGGWGFLLLIIFLFILAWLTATLYANILLPIAFVIIIAAIWNEVIMRGSEGELHDIKSSRGYLDNELSLLLNRRNEIQKQLNLIEAKLRDDRCNLD